MVRAAHTTLGKLCSLASPPPRLLEDLFLGTKGHTCGEKPEQGSQVDPLGRFPCLQVKCCPPHLGRGLKEAGGRPLLSAVFSLGSPNTNLPYLVTMETGAACQPYPTHPCFPSAAALGLREAESVQESLPREPPSSLEHQAPSEAAPLSNPALGEKSIGEKMCPPGICFYLFQGNWENKAANTLPFSSPQPAQNRGIKPAVH